jgi:hypothetical protein
MRTQQRCATQVGPACVSNRFRYHDAETLGTATSYLNAMLACGPQTCFVYMNCSHAAQHTGVTIGCAWKSVGFSSVVLQMWMILRTAYGEAVTWDAITQPHSRTSTFQPLRVFICFTCLHAPAFHYGYMHFTWHPLGLPTEYMLLSICCCLHLQVLRRFLLCCSLDRC